MSKLILSVAFIALLNGAQASWYWPFGSSERDVPRLSEIMEGASTNIDAAADFAVDGKLEEAIAGYERALAELDKVEVEYARYMDKPEFSTVKTKRAYVRAALDSLKLKQVKDNFKSVSVSDTAELEKKLAAERAAERAAEKPAAESVAGKQAPKPTEKPRSALRKNDAVAKNATPKERALSAIAGGRYAEAEKEIASMLRLDPKDVAALNLRAAMEAAQGDLKKAEETLDEVIKSNPRDYHGYYNMARVKLKAGPGHASRAEKYYETGRVYGGPRNVPLENAIKKALESVSSTEVR